MKINKKYIAIPATALAAGLGLAGCGNLGGSTPAVTITSCGLDSMGDPMAGYTVTNNSGQLWTGYIEVGFYQDGSEFVYGNDSPDVSAHTTYTGQVDDAGQTPPNLDPISCKVLTVN